MRELGYRTVDMLVERLLDESAPPLRRATPAEMRARISRPAARGAAAVRRAAAPARRGRAPVHEPRRAPGLLRVRPVRRARGRARSATSSRARATSTRARGWRPPARRSSSSQVLDWFRDWVGLPRERRRDAAERRLGREHDGARRARASRVVGAMNDRLVAYVSDQAHSSLARGGARPRLPPGSGPRAPGRPPTAASPATLCAAAIEADARAGRMPVLRLRERRRDEHRRDRPAAGARARCAREHGLWFHVDAAYGGFAVLTERGRRALDGIGRADSITLDPHKWLYQPYECGCLLVRDARCSAPRVRDDARLPARRDPGDGGGQLRRPRHPADAHVARAQGLAVAVRVRRRRASPRRSTAASTSPRRRGGGSTSRRRSSSPSPPSLSRRLLPAPLRLRRRRGGPAQRRARRGARAERHRPHLVDARRRPLRAAHVHPRPRDGRGSTSSACSRSSSRAEVERGAGRDGVRAASGRRAGAGSPAPTPASPTSSACRSSARCRPDELERLARAAELREAAGGETIVEQWEASKDFYVVLAGTVDVSVEGERIRELGPGEFFGELAALDWGSGFGYPRLATVVAASRRAAAARPGERARTSSCATNAGRRARDRPRRARAAARRPDVIDPLERWRELGDKPDYAGLLTFGGPAVHAGPGELDGRRRRDRRRADRRPRLGPAGHALRPARDPRRELPAGAAPRGGDRRDEGAADRRLRRRARDPGRSGADARRRSSAPSARWSRPARCRSSSAATTRSPSRTSAPARHRTAPSGSSTSTRTPTPARRCSASSVSHGTPMYRLVEAGHRRSDALRPDRAARLLARRGGVRVAARARDHELLHARRPRARHRGGRASATIEIGGRRAGVPVGRRRRARSRRSRRARARPSRAG